MGWLGNGRWSLVSVFYKMSSGSLSGTTSSIARATSFNHANEELLFETAALYLENIAARKGYMERWQIVTVQKLARITTR